MNYKLVFESYSDFLEKKISGRYLPFSRIQPLLLKLKKTTEVKKAGISVGGLAIHKIKIGNGKKKILMWSQMHGNESTTTKAVFDLINFLSTDTSIAKLILTTCEIHIIPMLNPDGASVYTRVNKNEVDLNRDAKNLSQPESKVLRMIFEEVKPDFCFNLHDQRTIFSVGKTNKPATVSFLSPAENEERAVTNTRKRSMELIGVMNKMLQSYIPDQVGRYDDTFNDNCVGDSFQSEGVPTVLFESGHFPGDYEREETRKLMFQALVVALDYISTNDVFGDAYEPYFKIPENDKLFYDIILRDMPIKINDSVELQDVGILYKEILINDTIIFEPSVENIGRLHYFYPHKEFMNCNKHTFPLKKSELTNEWLKDNLRIFQ